MPGLNEVHNSYFSRLNTFVNTTRKKRVDAKKDDEPELHSNKNTIRMDKEVVLPAFPLTPTMCFLSFLFWLFFSTAIYLSTSYGLMLSRITEESDLHGICSDAFQNDKAKNIQKVESYTIGEATPYLLRLRPSKQEDYPMESKLLSPLVTAITSAQFYQFQGLVKHIIEDIKGSHLDVKLIVYDLGLYRRERELMQQYCQCEVREFHFEQYPNHVSSISNYAWRPIILQLILEEFGSVLYVEPTTRLKNPSSLKYLRTRGSRNYFVWDNLAYTSLVGYTDKGMFEYFNESRCAFLGCSLVTPDAIAVYRTEASWVEMMKPWLSCALNEECIAPKYAKYSGCVEIRHPRTTGCHRYDMSALSIILNRGQQYTLDSKQMVSFRLTYTDISEVAFFHDQPWTYMQLLSVVFIPFLLIVVYKYIIRKRRLCRL